MHKRYALLFIFSAALVHFGCFIALFSDVMSRAACNIPPYTGCVTPESQIFGAIVSFPLGSLANALGIYQGHHPISFGLCLINSLTAGVTIWGLTSVVVCLFRRNWPKKSL